jgi:hypothetical protein
VDGILCEPRRIIEQKQAQQQSDGGDPDPRPRDLQEEVEGRDQCWSADEKEGRPIIAAGEMYRLKGPYEQVVLRKREDHKEPDRKETDPGIPKAMEG